MKYELNIPDRKALIRRAQALTEESGNYTFLPRCAYEFQGFSIEKDGSLEAGEDADRSILETLLAEGLIRKGEAGEEIKPEDTAEAETTEETEPAGVEEPTEAEEPEAENPVETTETEQDEPAEETESDEVSEEPEDATDIPQPETEPEGIDPEDIGEETGFVKPSISLPLEGHSGRSLRNLIFLLYSRGHLISKSTGGDFGADDDLVEELKIASEYPTANGLIEHIRKFEAGNGKAVRGIEITEDKVVFTGFPVTDDPDEVQAFVHLASLMNRQSIEQNRIQTKPVDETNEKYSMRTWLLRIGMNGDEFKETRSILMKRLDGHTAFRTPADAERWKAHRKAIRDKQKAALEADTTPDGGTIPDAETTADAEPAERVVS